MGNIDNGTRRAEKPVLKTSTRSIRNMIAKLLYLLEELKDNFEPEKLNDIISCLNDTAIGELYNNTERSRSALNGQNKLFYSQLSIDFIDDLNSYTEMYFSTWQSILDLFDDRSKSLFYQSALELSGQTDVTDYINGIMELDKGNPEIAMFHFNRIDDYIAMYFMALCYLDSENYENCIKQNEGFLKRFKFEITDTDSININEIDEIVLTKWNVYGDLTYCYCRLYEFEKAYIYFQKSLEIFDIEFVHNISTGTSGIIFFDNYLLALERTNRYKDCMELLDFLISKYPEDRYYLDKKSKISNIQNKNGETDVVFSQLFRPKRPFDIDNFQSTKLISKEKVLEDMIIEQIKYGFKVFDRALEVYQDNEIYGRQYRIPQINGILDLLLIDKAENQIYVVELKRNEAGTEVVSQIENYMQALSKQLNKEIKGIICLHKPDERLTELVKTKKDIELYTYHFEFIKK